MKFKNYILIIIIILGLISKEYIYISDEFLVIFSFIIIVALFFSKLSEILSSTLDEYAQKISNNAKELVVLQQKVLYESKVYQEELLNLQVRIKAMTAYILEETADIADICEQKYLSNIDSYLNNKLLSLLLLDIEYYEKIYSEIYFREIDTVINSSIKDKLLFGESETENKQSVFFPFLDSV